MIKLKIDFGCPHINKVHNNAMARQAEVCQVKTSPLTPENCFCPIDDFWDEPHGGDTIKINPDMGDLDLELETFMPPSVVPEVVIFCIRYESDDEAYPVTIEKFKLYIDSDGMLYFSNRSSGQLDKYKFATKKTLEELKRKRLRHDAIKKDRQKCFRCGKIGHQKKECPMPKKMRKCHRCGSPGHLKSECPH